MPVKRHDPPPPGAVPGKSSLKTQNSPTSTNSSEQSGRSFSPFKSLNARRTSSSTHSPQPFRRNSFGRQSERFTRSTTARPSLAAALDSFTLPANNTSNAPVLVRNSLLRRSLNALKRKATRQQSYSVTAVVAANPSPKMASEEADEKAKLLPNTEIAKPFWKRLFVNNKRNNSQQLSTVPEIGESKNFKIKAPFLAGYKGNGKSFEKIGRGEEITLVLFGHPKCGKTSFVNAIKEAFTRPAILVGPGFSVPRTLTLNDRFGLVGYSESDNCLPSLVPLLLNVDGKNVYVDVIEGEYVHEECASSPYAAAADAAILMLDSTTCASLLSAHQVQRCLARVQHDLGTSVEYSVVVNKVRSVPEAIQRALSESECANLARSLRTTHWEIDTAKGDFDALLAAEMIWSLCSQVLRRRAAADAKIVKESQLV